MSRAGAMGDKELMAHATTDTRGWDAAEGARWGVPYADYSTGGSVEYLTVIADDEQSARSIAEEYLVRIVQLDPDDYEVLDDIEPEDDE